MLRIVVKQVWMLETGYKDAMVANLEPAWYLIRRTGHL